MNTEMAYLLGMICGNGEIKRKLSDTTITIEIPHKKLETEEVHDVKLYVKASIADIKRNIEPLIGATFDFIQNDSSTVLYFTKPSTDYLIREINKYIGNAVSHNEISIHEDVFKCSVDERRQFLKGFADVTGYIRRSNAYYRKYEHRVYLEIPNNWQMVIDICNLLKSIDIPVQTIDWAHPNMRDGNLKKFNNKQANFWKKEHQIKIWANEFNPVGFGIIHKQQALDMFSEELIAAYKKLGKDVKKKTHKYYWQTKRKSRVSKPNHPGENDDFIPEVIRGKHFDSWKEIAKELGYHE